MPEAAQPSMTAEEAKALGDQLGFIGATGALVGKGVQVMLKKKANELADGILKSAGAHEGFDLDNPLHIAYLQEFVKKAKESCVDCWHGLDHVRKVASRDAMRETFDGLLILEKWAAILEKTALLPDAQLSQLQEDPEMFQEFANLRNNVRQTTLGGAMMGGTAGGAAGYHFNRNPLAGAVGGALLGGALARMSVPVDLQTANIVNAARMRQQGRLNG